MTEQEMVTERDMPTGQGSPTERDGRMDFLRIQLLTTPGSSFDPDRETLDGLGVERLAMPCRPTAELRS